MSQEFSFNRVNLLVRMHWAENKKRYGLSLLAFMALLIIWFLFVLSILEPHDSFAEVQKTTFYFPLFAIGTFYASQYFSALGSKERASNFLLVPASTLEKVFCSILYMIFFIIVFSVTFYIVDIVMSNISKSVPDIVQVGENTIVNVFNVGFFMFREELRINGLLFFLSVQSAFLFGAVYFKKYSFIKTIISVFILYFVIFCITYFLFQPFSDSNHVGLPYWIEQGLQVFIMYVMAPLFWILTYYQLKQKQV